MCIRDRNVAGNLGKDPGVDYEPKAGDEQKFAALHVHQKHDYPHDNEAMFTGKNIPYSLDTPQNKHMGNKEADAKKGYFAPVKEAKETESVMCNESPKGVECPVHGIVECWSASGKKMNEKDIKEAMTPKQKQYSNRVKTMPGKKGHVMGAASNFEAPFHKVHATVSKNGGAKEVVKHELQAKDKHDAVFNVQLMHHKAGHKIHDVKHKGMVKEEIDPGFSESKKDEYVSCNHTPAGTKCPMHEMADCTMSKTIKELSNKTLGGYVQGATRDALSKQYSLGKGEKVDTNKLMNRRKGIDKAVDKMAKEEVEQIDELSTGTMHSYRDAAADSIAHSKRSLKRKEGDRVAHALEIKKRNKGLDLAGERLAKKEMGEEVEELDELSTDLLHRAAHKAAKVAMTDVQGRSGPIFKKRAAQANKFRAKGMAQEKKEKAMKEEIVDEAYGSSSGKTATGTKWSDNSVSVSVHHDGKKHTFTGKHDYVAKKLKDAHGMGMHQVNFKKASDMKEEALDELSKETLKSYVKKVDQRGEGVKRGTGLNTASQKIAKQEPTSTLKKTVDAIKKTPHGKMKSSSVYKFGASHAELQRRGVKEETIDEVLTKSTTAGETIHDFVHSDNPKFKGKSKEKRKEMALAAYYAKQRNESVEEAYAVEPLLGSVSGSHDIAKYKTDDTQDEIDMVRTELKAIANKTMHMLSNMPADHHIEPWVQSKIAAAKEMIGAVHDYMMYSDDDEEDEQTDTPVTFPNMANDSAAGVNV